LLSLALALLSLQALLHPLTHLTHAHDTAPQETSEICFECLALALDAPFTLPLVLPTTLAESTVFLAPVCPLFLHALHCAYRARAPPNFSVSI
jgi:hypothetical protein